MLLYLFLAIVYISGIGFAIKIKPIYTVLTLNIISLFSIFLVYVDWFGRFKQQNMPNMFTFQFIRNRTPKVILEQTDEGKIQKFVWISIIILFGMTLPPLIGMLILHIECVSKTTYRTMKQKQKDLFSEYQGLDSRCECE